MLAYRALEDGDAARLVELLDAHPELVQARGTNGNDLLGMAGDARARPAAARARRRPEPRQRLRLDEAPPGRLLEPAASSRS